MNTKKLLIAAIGAFALVAVHLVAPELAQASGTTGAIEGIVTDGKTSEVIADVTIVATSPSLEGTLSAITNDKGAYKIDNLPPGDYSVAFYYAGNTVERTNVHVSSECTMPVHQKLNQVAVTAHADEAEAPPVCRPIANTPAVAPPIQYDEDEERAVCRSISARRCAAGCCKLSSEETSEVLPRFGAGLEVATGIYTGLVGFRGRFGLDHLLAARSPEPRLSVGLTFGFGQFYNDSEPKSGMRHEYIYGSIGPEVMYVLDSVGDDADVRVFAAAAIVNTFFQYQYRDRTDGWGGRISIGVNAAARMWRQVDEGMKHDKCDMGSSGGCGAPFLIMALPHQFELTAEHDHGTTRFGLVIGYGY